MSMGARTALRVAIELFHMPSRVRSARAAPLPPGVILLLEIAAGDAEAEQRAAASTGRPGELVRHAAVFFIEQVMLCQNADSYRVLGADPQTGSGDLRRNMALLVRWLHPDKAADEQRSVFVGRINQAWNDLKTPERRARYDHSRGLALAQKRALTARPAATFAGPARSPYRAPAARGRGAQPRGLFGRAWLFLMRAARR